MNTTAHDTLTSTISVRLTTEERWALELQASREDRTVSNLVRKCIRESLLRETPNGPQ